MKNRQRRGGVQNRCALIILIIIFDIIIPIVNPKRAVVLII